ncbi:MAG: sulfurtransferase, partial [Alphaproteobacteria bacterium]
SHHTRAARVWTTLRHSGFDDAAVLDGGWTKWTREGRPTETGSRVHPPARFEGASRAGVFVDRVAVAAALDDPSVRLVNALGADQHAGTGGVQYGRPGRLPGSVNVPARALVDPETDAFLPPDRLRAVFGAAGALDRERIVVYCGGGVAASCDALALALIGREAAVYARSLQEWAADPDLPMERDP